MTGIEIRGLRKCYGRQAAVDSLDLDIEAGSCVGLLGVNGAGKTTTIKMLACMTQPSGGDARILGHSILREPQAVRALLAVSPQETAVAPNLTVRENLELIAGIYGAPRRAAREAAEQSMESFRLTEIAGKRAGKLSGGWQRRLSLAMALISEPKVLFLDEPTLGLDVLARRELWTEIRRLKGGMTILLTTHYLEEAAALCDRIAVLNAGKLRACGTVADLLARTGTENLEDAFARLAGEGTV